MSTKKLQSRGKGPGNLISAVKKMAALVISAVLLATSFVPQTGVRAEPTAPQHRITWDSHSILIDGHRILLYSGEFHYWRLPSQSQWRDRLEKIKAAGLNAVSIYFDWQYHSNAPGEYDFTGVRDVNYLLDIADKLGIYVLARVGPYMNAEVDAGGLPGWVLSKQLFPRAQTWDGTNPKPQYSALYAQYSKEWYDHLLPILAKHQATSGGSVLMLSIENEYNQDTGSSQYMQDLYRYARADGIQVPIFHNDFYFKGDWSKLVDLYAYDSYPFGFQCCHQWWDTHFQGIDTWEATLRSGLNINTPMFVSELQGGSFDGWGGVGYAAVAKTLGADWLTALDESALAQGTDILNTYMFAGGTSWGYMSEPNVYTSYDYGAAIAESGALRPAYYAAHRLGMFLQAYGSSLAGAASAAAPLVTNPSIVAHARTNSDTGQMFTFLRHGDAGQSVRIKVQISMGSRSLMVPQKRKTYVTVPGHGSEILVSNSATGPLHLNYSTSQVLTDAETANGHYLVVYGAPDSDGETDFTLPTGSLTVTHNTGVQVTKQNGELRLNYLHTAEPRTVSIQTAAGPLHILITTAAQASRYWLANRLLISGPNLVKVNGDQLTLSNHQRQDVQVYGAAPDQSLSIDGRLTSLPDAMSGRTLLGKVGPSSTAVRLPVLQAWKFQSEGQEISPSFDDSGWQRADHTATTNPNVPPGPSTLADDYGFHYGFVWYRGHFTPSGSETAISIRARHHYSVYLNGTYLGSGSEPLTSPPHQYASWQTFSLPTGVLKSGQDNVLSILTESMGHDEGWVAGPAAQSPQGLLGAQFSGAATSIIWRIQGATGGEQPADRQRGLLNASGLYGERHGWYETSFNDGGWQQVALPDSWKGRGTDAAIGWYRTHFGLNLPRGGQTPVALTLPHVSDKATIWLNGWLIGRYWEQKGPQHTFYLPQGVLNPAGDNVLAIAVWNRGHEGGLISVPKLSTYQTLKDHILALGSKGLTENGYWHTSGDTIVDAQEHPVRIAAVNWSGMQGARFVPAGLDRQPLAAIVQRIRGLGFNTIRLPFSNQLIEQNPVVSAGVEANPDLRGLHALEVMDRIVAAAKAAGERVILDDHRSSIGTDPEGNGLWYTSRYPESSWINDWKTLAKRYEGDSTVIGVDLRNEPHTGPPGPWSVKTYLHQGATWGPYRGIENHATDWRLAAQRGGDAVLSVNPHLLIFVEGLQQYPDPSQPGGLDSYWWAGVFQPAAQYPLELSVKHQLVYSPHEYGPIKWQMPFFGPHMSYQSQSAVWKKHWAFLQAKSYSARAPIFIGEFGTCGKVTCVQDTTPGSQGLWFSLMMRYLKYHPQISWSFWALNGTNPLGADQPNYVLRSDWKSARQHILPDTLRDIEGPPSPVS